MSYKIELSCYNRRKGLPNYPSTNLINHEGFSGHQHHVLLECSVHDHVPGVVDPEAPDPHEHAAGRHRPLAKVGQVLLGRSLEKF